MLTMQVANCSIEIDYSPKAADNHGRRYCCTVGGQRLPRAARLELFGQTHCEIDLKGSFYELVRRLGLLFAPDLVPLPNIDEFRAQIARDPYIQKVEAICPDTIKQLPLRIINSSLDARYRYLSSLVDDAPKCECEHNPKQRSAQGSPHICTTPLEALAKLRARCERPT